MQQQITTSHRARYPGAGELRPREETVFTAPAGYSDTFDHFRNFFDAVRSRKPVMEDAVFGYRAAGPAVLTNASYFEEQPIGWDPERMRRMPGPAKPARTRDAGDAR